MTPLISVIIPVYNVENYIKECLDSVISQTYKNIEIILVNDGSTDNSLKILKEYEKLDTRIKVFSKENGGVSSTRNYGISFAKGEYLTFVDSDDYVDSKLIETTLNYINNADIVVIESSYYKKIKIEKLSPEKCIKNIFKDNKILTAPWGKLYKKSLFDNLEFPNGLIFEDFQLIPIVFSRAKNVIYCNKKLYYYRTTPNSIMNSSFSHKKMDYFKVTENVYEFIKCNYPKLLIHLKNRTTRYAVSFYKQLSYSGYQNQEDIDFIVKKIKSGLFSYLFSSNKLTSKLYCLFVAIAPKKAYDYFYKKGNR